MAYTEASKKASIKYRKEHIKRVEILMQNEEYTELKQYADSKNKPVGTVIKDAIKKEIKSK